MINRRQSLGLAAGLVATPTFASSYTPAAGSAATAQAAAAAAASKTAGGDAAAIAALVADPLLTHVRMRGHQDGRRCYFSYHGTFYAQVSGQRTQPMFYIEGASSARMMRQPDGSYLYTMREAGWFCDLKTREPQAEATNPFTGKLIKPRHYNSAQQSRLSLIHMLFSNPASGWSYRARRCERFFRRRPDILPGEQSDREASWRLGAVRHLIKNITSCI